MNEEIKPAYQFLLNLGLDLKKIVDDKRALYNTNAIFSDVFYIHEFGTLMYKFLNSDLTKEQLKEKISGKLTYGFNLINNEIKKDKEVQIDEN